MEKLLIKLITVLLERAVDWILKKLEQNKVDRREHERIQQASNRLQNATSVSDFDNAVDELP
jgi:hypothetical protein